MNKTKMIISISEHLNLRFRSFLAEKYRTVEKGMISHEVSQALGHWIAMHTDAQKSLINNKPNPTPKVISAYIEIKEYLLSKFYEELHSGSTVVKRHFEEAIMNVRGSDKRTIKKWLKTFRRMGLIKILNASTMELM